MRANYITINAPSMTDALPNHRLEYWRTRRGLSQSQLGQMSGTSQNAIWKLENGKMELKAHHLPAFARALKVRPIDILPEEYVSDDIPSPTEFEEEVEPYQYSEERANKAQDTVNFLDFILSKNPKLSAWTLNSKALTGAGYLPGDVLVTEIGKTPIPGDIVCAQVYSTTEAETVFRIFQPPFLIASTSEDALRTPYLVDNIRVKIMGTVTQTHRMQ